MNWLFCTVTEFLKLVKQHKNTHHVQLSSVILLGNSDNEIDDHIDPDSESSGTLKDISSILMLITVLLHAKISLFVFISIQYYLQTGGF